ncbi:MAG: CE1759 family FMN reductase [Marmoricola sp.]
MKSLVVVSAGLSDPSSTSLLAKLLTDATVAAAGQDLEVIHVELRPLAHALTDHLLTGFASAELAGAQQAVARADAVIAVTPVFSASYSGLFKTFFDVLEQGALDGTPVLLGATAGTARHSLVIEHALRPLMAYLHAVPVPTGVFAASEDFGGRDLEVRVKRAAGELATLLASRPATARLDQFDRDLAAMGSFEDLLNG